MDAPRKECRALEHLNALKQLYATKWNWSKTTKKCTKFVFLHRTKMVQNAYAFNCTHLCKCIFMNKNLFTDMYIQRNANSQKFCEWTKTERERCMCAFFRIVRFARKNCIELWAHWWFNLLGADWCLLSHHKSMGMCTQTSRLSSLSLLHFFFSFEWNWCPNEYADFVFIPLGDSQIASFFCTSPFRRKILSSIVDTHINGFVSKRDKQPICSVWFSSGTSLGSFYLCGRMKNNKMPWWWLSQSIELSKQCKQYSISISRQTEVEQEIGGTARFKFIMSCHAMPHRKGKDIMSAWFILRLDCSTHIIIEESTPFWFGKCILNDAAMYPSTNQINWRTI